MQGWSFTKYDDDHFVLHLDRRALLMLMAVQSFLHIASDSVCGVELFNEMLKSIGSNDGPDDMDPSDYKLYSDIRSSIEGKAIDGLLVKFPSEPEDKKALAAEVEELKGSRLWRSFEAGVPDERKDEVLRQLMRVKDKKLDRELASSFGWAGSPQGHDYWRAWYALSKGELADLPPIPNE